jgi:hypothetical protein
LPTAQTCGAEKPLPTLMTAAAEQTIASAAKLAALQIAVEAMLGHHLAALPQSESLAFKAHLLGLGGYELAERPITAAEAMASFTAAEVSDLVLRASAQEALLRPR